jgi:hypothetical protein
MTFVIELDPDETAGRQRVFNSEQKSRQTAGLLDCKAKASA